MKLKLLISAILLSTATLAGAQSVTVGYAQRVLDSGAQEHQTGLSVRTATYGAFTGDVGFSSVQKDTTNAITNRTEVGVTYKYALPLSMSADFRAAHGWKSKSGSETTQYYVLEPSVTYSVPSTMASVKVGYRVREAYSASVADNSTTARVALGYKLSKNDRISIGRDWQRGDGALTQTSLQYTRAF
jgi:hypothetical protein